jgi:class 3 adenylate cyclase
VANCHDAVSGLLDAVLVRSLKRRRLIAARRARISEGIMALGSSGTTMNVAGWLRSLGLEQYEVAFRDNEINELVLPNLTLEDLKEIGVGPVGHRRLLLEAIAALRAKTSNAPHANAAHSVSPEDRAERRQVTVMFSDLVGSTALSARMDPEDLHEVISAYQRCVAGAVRRFDGFVAKYMGDGVLVYFGYPQAHEDDAERAVRAALEAIAAVGALKMSVPLQARIGIATGLVVVGDLIGAGSAQEQAIVGETPNLAARLQSIAKANAVVIAESTRRLIGSLFELADLGLQDLKGIDALARAWAVLQVSSVESRFEAFHGGGLIELVGRQEELDLLLRRWRRAASGEGQVVLLAGEPGIGKSRLIAALQERLQTELHTRLRYSCSPQRLDSALYPIIAQLERAAGVTREDTPEAQFDKLAALFVLASPPQEHQALLAELLSIPTKGRFPVLQLTPRDKKEKTFEALLRQLNALAQQRPVLMLFEDVHWIDPSSRELLDLVVERVQHLPVFLLITFRPEFERIWTGQAHVTMLSLNRLDRREGAALVQHIIGDGTLASDVVSEIVERTDGVPLFLEELTKAVLEADDRSARTALSRISRTALAIPATLHASLMARLDRLGSPAKEVAQAGAAIGREFSYELLLTVAQRNSAELDEALDQLVSAELVFRRGMPPDAEYSFKHALVQDAAYSTLLRAPRQKLHARIAEVLEQLFPRRVRRFGRRSARSGDEVGVRSAYCGRRGRRRLGRLALVLGR